jgi:hypothetical protein
MSNVTPGEVLRTCYNKNRKLEAYLDKLQEEEERRCAELYNHAFI